MIQHRWKETTLLLLACLMLLSCSKQPQPGEVPDEAKRAGRNTVCVSRRKAKAADRPPPHSLRQA